MLSLKKKIKLQKDNINGIKYVLTELIVSGITFISIPFFTRVMSPDEFGKISIYVSLVSIISIVIGFNFHSGVIRYSVESNNNLKFINSINILVLINFSIAIVLTSFLNIGSLKKIICIMAIITATFQIFINLYLELLRAEKQVNKYMVVYISLSLLNNILSILVIIMVSYSPSIIRIGTICFSYILVGSYASYQMLTKYKANINKTTIKYFLKFCLPLIPFAFSSLILSISDRFIIKMYYSDYEVGIYSFSYSIATIIYILIIGLNKSFQPKYFDNIIAKKNNNIMIKNYYKIFFCIYIAFILSSDFVVNIFANKTYGRAREIIPVIGLGYIFFFVYCIYVTEIYYSKKTFKLTIITIIAAISNLILNFIFVPIFGFVAAAYTTSISYLILSILTYLIVKLDLKVSNINNKLILKYTIILIVITCIKIIY